MGLLDPASMFALLDFSGGLHEGAEAAAARHQGIVSGVS